MRLFISINVPPELHDHCRRLQGLFPGMRNTEEFHLTLQFLGDDIHEQFLPRITEALRKIDFQPFEIRLGAPRHFPDDDRPKGAWIDCDGGKALSDLADRIRSAMEKTGFPPDKPFVAHVTLGRYKALPHLSDSRRSLPRTERGEDGQKEGGRPQTRDCRSGTTSPHTKTEAQSFKADRFCLMQSHLGPEGPTHKILDAFLSR